MALPIGGKRPGAGRKPGTPNKVTADVKEFALQFTIEAIEGIVAIARDLENPAAVRGNMWEKLLDRAIGKPVQSLEHTGKDGKALHAPSFEVVFVGPSDARDATEEVEGFEGLH